MAVVTLNSFRGSVILNFAQSTWLEKVLQFTLLSICLESGHDHDDGPRGSGSIFRIKLIHHERRLRMYCIDRHGVPESHDAHALHC